VRLTREPAGQCSPNSLESIVGQTADVVASHLKGRNVTTIAFAADCNRDKLNRPSGWGRLMHRREFIAAFVGAIVGTPALWQRAACAQQAAKVRTIGVLTDSRFNADVIVEELARLGWVEGRNARIEQRWTKGEINRLSAFATEIVAAQPHVISALPRR
jgi:hypothetical protein